MKAIANNICLQYGEDDKPQIVLSLQMPRREAQEAISKFKEILSKGKYLDVEIKQHRNKRSLDANAYLWVLCQKIAEATRNTKENVYKEFIRRVGQFEIFPIKNEAVEKWIQTWQSHGIGWVSEAMGESKFQGYTTVISYYGSSVYDTKEMSILLDEVVNQCHELGIETMSPQELESLKQAWGRGG